MNNTNQHDWHFWYVYWQDADGHEDIVPQDMEWEEMNGFICWKLEKHPLYLENPEHGCPHDTWEELKEFAEKLKK